MNTATTKGPPPFDELAPSFDHRLPRVVISIHNCRESLTTNHLHLSDHSPTANQNCAPSPPLGQRSNGQFKAYAGLWP
ncbi:hypothetical protein L484_026459 [Morus notabilis]|uniref:Uncharacterized protein n=1 Tax=Morus notabilis TaxID=981085 RepID=W9RAK9_9ROSA|nr:hypothetical protein L484_026459 [Morus notabilis]